MYFHAHFHTCKCSGASFVILKYSNNFSLNALRVSGFCLSNLLLTKEKIGEKHKRRKPIAKTVLACRQLLQVEPAI